MRNRHTSRVLRCWRHCWWSEESSDDWADAAAGSAIERCAEQYVKLVLAVGQHDADYVDAFYGPPEWRKEAEAREEAARDDRCAGGGDRSAAGRSCRLAAGERPDAELWALRRQYLDPPARGAALARRDAAGQEVHLRRGVAGALRRGGADQAGRRVRSGARAAAAKLPGEGSLIDRYDRFKAGVRHPEDAPRSRLPGSDPRLPRPACRASQLPLQERFTVEYVTGKSWSGYNWYQGNYKSLIQVNTDLPIYIDRADRSRVPRGLSRAITSTTCCSRRTSCKDRGWIEYTVYPLFSPQSLIAEGTANYGIEVAFSTADRLRFESDVLFPLAGLDASKARGVLRRCSRSSIASRMPATKPRATTWTARSIATRRGRRGSRSTRCIPKPRAEQRVKFIEQYRSYVINYNLGKDLIRAYVEKQMGRDKTRAARAGASSRRCSRRRGCRQG